MQSSVTPHTLKFNSVYLYITFNNSHQGGVINCKTIEKCLLIKNRPEVNVLLILFMRQRDTQATSRSVASRLL